MDMMTISALAVLALVGGFVGLFLYLGHRSGRGDLIAPPREFGKREYDQRPPVKPVIPAAPKTVAPPKERAPDPMPPVAVPDQTAEELVAAISEPMPEPAPEPEPVAADGEIAPEWRRDAPSGNARLSEACYTAEQYAEREVKALLLQNHPNRAFTHARRALKLSDEEAMDFVERVASGLRV